MRSGGRRAVWPDPVSDPASGKVGDLLGSREVHEELIDHELEMEHVAKEGRPPGPGRLDRFRSLFRRADG